MINPTRDPTPPTSRPIRKYEIFDGLDFKMKYFIYMKYELMRPRRFIQKFIFASDRTYFRINKKAKEIKKLSFTKKNCQNGTKKVGKFDNKIQ